MSHVGPWAGGVVAAAALSEAWLRDSLADTGSGRPGRLCKSVVGFIRPTSPAASVSASCRRYSRDS